MQICALADQYGRDVLVPLGFRSAFFQYFFRPLLLLESFINILRIGVYHFSFKGFLVALLQGAWLANILKRYSGLDLWIEVTRGRTMLLAALLGASGQSYVAYPHNVEFLVPGQCQGYFSGRASEFFVEQYVYSRASNIFAISDFDAAVIRSLGIVGVDVLPYSPVGSLRDELLLIRNLRESSDKNHILILGTVGNAPTRDGIDKLLQLISQECSQSVTPNRTYKLAGYGTETFRDVAPSSVLVLGSVSQDYLRELLVTCRALLVMQPQTSGMLTRIMEAEIASIPVYVLGDYIQSLDPALNATKSISSLSQLP